MHKKLTANFNELIETGNQLPCISLIMPFEPKMKLKKELDQKLKQAFLKIENELQKNYPADKANDVLEKTKELIKVLNYETHKKSIAIFVSPLIEKVYYLDLTVEEKILIDDSFEIRDLIYCKKQIHKYLLAELSNKWTKIYLGNATHFVPVLLNVPHNMQDYKSETSEILPNFNYEKKRAEILLENFLKHTDNGLSLLLQAYRFPLFVMGTVNTIEHFKKITQNAKQVMEYIPGNYEDKSEAELHKIMEPHVADWKKIIQNDLMRQINEALNHKKLAIGIKEVWKEAAHKKGRLLVVEKNYIYPTQQNSKAEIFFINDELMKNAFYIKDAVDDVIEKVLAAGGDVEFVDEGFLKDFHRIVLIEYYSS